MLILLLLLIYFIHFFYSQPLRCDAALSPFPVFPLIEVRGQAQLQSRMHVFPLCLLSHWPQSLSLLKEGVNAVPQDSSKRLKLYEVLSLCWVFCIGPTEPCGISWDYSNIFMWLPEVSCRALFFLGHQPPNRNVALFVLPSVSPLQRLHWKSGWAQYFLSSF